MVMHIYLIIPFWTNGREYAKEAMKQYFCCTNEREPHTQPKKTTRVSNVRCFRYLFIFLKSFGIWIFYKDIKHYKIIPGVIEYCFF